MEIITAGSRPESVYLKLSVILIFTRCGIVLGDDIWIAVTLIISIQFGSEDYIQRYRVGVLRVIV